MPTQDPSLPPLDKYIFRKPVFGPIRPSEYFHWHAHQAVGAHSYGQGFFTEISLRYSSIDGFIRAEYTVMGSSERDAERTGAVNLSQLCDLISVVARKPVWFYMREDDSREEMSSINRRAERNDRILMEPEWSSITENLAFICREHPRFLAAASWYRKGLIDRHRNRDCLDSFCCFARVIERLAYTYADKSTWTDNEKSNAPANKYLDQLVSDLFTDGSVPEILSDAAAIERIKKLRDDLSHGDIPFSPEVIDEATDWLKRLEDAAFSVLQRIRERKLAGDIFA